LSFAQRILRFHRDLRPDWSLPPGVELLYPYANEETKRVMHVYYQRYYNDERPRIGLFGINPGRFGAGVTGLPFTDPPRLERVLGIANAFDKKPELSAEFVYAVIDAFGGPAAFTGDFYITSLSPLGFIKNGKNYNYYDDAHLRGAVEPYIIEHIHTQIDLGLRKEIAFCLGQGQNMACFSRLNEQHGFFKAIQALPHPRWVMQYRRRSMAAYVEMYVTSLKAWVR
jgi:hypothetical protein